MRYKGGSYDPELPMVGDAMTEEQWIDLGKRAVACKGWRWMPGMLARYKGDAWCRVTDADSFGLPTRVRLPNPRRAWPDFRDPATVGCLLALVREVWEPHRGSSYIASTMCTGSGWGVGDPYESEAAIVLPTYGTEVAALVAALEAADD